MPQALNQSFKYTILGSVGNLELNRHISPFGRFAEHSLVVQRCKITSSFFLEISDYRKYGVYIQQHKRHTQKAIIEKYNLF